MKEWNQRLSDPTATLPMLLNTFT